MYMKKVDSGHGQVKYLIYIIAKQRGLQDPWIKSIINSAISQ